MSQPFKTARCILYRDGNYLLAVHSSFWGARQRRWGLPGGRIETGESPQTAILRELEEELEVRLSDVMEIGAFPYKRALHMVYAAPLSGEIDDYDSRELLDIGWFSEPDVVALKARSELHSNYELEAIRALMQKLAP
ncbi:MAG: NUDIX hydrolase [Pseudomonadales bacterium]